MSLFDPPAWSVDLRRDGELVAERVPVTDWQAAEAVAALFAQAGTVSLTAAVVAARDVP